LGDEEGAKVFACDPFGSGDVRAGSEGSTYYFTYVVHEQVVIFGAAFSIGHDALEVFEELDRLDVEAGFLEDFSLDGLVEGLAGFDQSAGEGPIAFERFLAALDHKDAIAFEYECADAY
jgi:hypothetical protein